MGDQDGNNSSDEPKTPAEKPSEAAAEPTALPSEGAPETAPEPAPAPAPPPEPAIARPVAEAAAPVKAPPLAAQAADEPADEPVVESVVEAEAEPVTSEGAFGPDDEWDDRGESLLGRVLRLMLVSVLVIAAVGALAYGALFIAGGPAGLQRQFANYFGPRAKSAAKVVAPAAAPAAPAQAPAPAQMAAAPAAQIPPPPQPAAAPQAPAAPSADAKALAAAQAALREFGIVGPNLAEGIRTLASRRAASAASAQPAAIQADCPIHAGAGDLIGTVYFASGSTGFTALDIAILNSFARGLEGRNVSHVDVVGFADAEENEAAPEACTSATANAALACERANRVAAAMTKRAPGVTFTAAPAPKLEASAGPDRCSRRVELRAAP